MELSAIQNAGMSGMPIFMWKKVDGELKKVIVDWLPIKSLEPVTPTITEEEMKQHHPANTICQVLREIHWLAEEGASKDEIQYQCRIAATMADKMIAKLREYKADWILELPDQRHLTQCEREEWDERIERLTGTVWMAVADPETNEAANLAVAAGSAEVLPVSGGEEILKRILKTRMEKRNL